MQRDVRGVHVERDDAGDVLVDERAVGHHRALRRRRRSRGVQQLREVTVGDLDLAADVRDLAGERPGQDVGQRVSTVAQRAGVLNIAEVAGDRVDGRPQRRVGEQGGRA
jgi:hypothetical protein